MAKKKPEETALVKTETGGAIAQQENTAHWITVALDKGYDPDKLTKLFDLHERAENIKAKIAYNEAMRAAQEQIKSVVADCENTQTKSWYPSLEALKKAVKKPCADNGLCLSFNEGKTELQGYCRTVADVRHVGGHVETFYLDLPLDGVGIKGNANMTAIHGRLSSDTYAQSRLIVKIFNVAISGDSTDNDGNDTSVIDGDQMVQVNTLIEQLKTFMPFNLQKFCDWLRIPDLGKLQRGDFDKAVAELQNRIRIGPEVKKILDNWGDWFAGKPSLEELNKHLIGQFKIMDTGPAKDLAWKFCVERADELGYAYHSKDGVFKLKK